MSISATGAVTMVRSLLRIMSVVSTSAATMTRSKTFAKALSVTVTATIAMVRSLLRVMAINPTGVPVIVRTINLIRSVASSAAVSLASPRTLLRALTVAVTSAATMLRARAKTLSVAVTGTVTLSRSIARIMGASSAATATYLRVIAKTLSSTSGILSFLGSIYNIVTGAPPPDFFKGYSTYRIGKAARDAVMSVLRSNLNDNLATVYAEYGLDPVSIDWQSGFQCFQGPISVDQLMASSDVKYPIIIVYTVSAQDQKLIHYKRFSGTVQVAIEFHQEILQGRSLPDYESYQDAFEDALVATLHGVEPDFLLRQASVHALRDTLFQRQPVQVNAAENWHLMNVASMNFELHAA
jgi:hypothetical protein